MTVLYGVAEEVGEWVPDVEQGGDSDRPYPFGGDERGWREELEVARVSAGYFVDRFGVIDYPRSPVIVGLGGGVEVSVSGGDGAAGGGGLGGTVPFRLWPRQVPVMAALQAERLLVILKARQLGISWLVCAYVLWLALFHPNQQIFLYSKGQAEASEMLRRVKALYDRLPEGLRRLLPGVAAGLNNTRAMGFANGSVIRSMPSTEKAGVSHTASLVVMDEAAHVARGEKLYEMVKPIMEAGGQLVILSTANGSGDWFHKLWQAAERGTSGFFRIFLPWWARPTRDEAWYRRVLKDALDVEKVRENYPATASEAFRSTGRNRFRPAWIDRQTANLIPPLPDGMLPRAIRRLDIPGLEVWGTPVPGRRYVWSADVAEGLEHGDYNAALCFDAESWFQVAQVHHREEPADYSEHLALLADWYNMAWCWPERNNHGHAILTAWRLRVDGEGRPRPFTRAGRGPDKRPGWETNIRTKPEGVDSVAEVLKEAAVTLRSEKLAGELRDFKRLRAGKLGAEKGGFDDLVMALVIGVWVLRQGRETATGGPATTGVERRRGPVVLGASSTRPTIIGGRWPGPAGLRSSGVGSPIRASRHTRRR